MLKWIADQLLASIRGKAQVSLTIRAASRYGIFVPMDRPTPKLQEVVIRVAVGAHAVEIERVGIRLDDGAQIEFEGGVVLPKVVQPPGHVEQDTGRESLAKKVGNRRVKELFAEATDGTQYKRKVPREWTTTESWPEAD